MGRPRKFDAEKALERALKVFWRKGYEGTSLPDLTKAMRINRPSLYAAFGNKEALFRKVVERYAASRAVFIEAALAAPTAREAMQRVLCGLVESQCMRGQPRGCMMVQGALSCGAEAEPIRRELVSRRMAAEQLLRARFARGIAEGDLRGDVGAADLARFYATVMQGMAVQATSGATREELRAVGEMAMKAWPE